jgi:hypothetical protein
MRKLNVNSKPTNKPAAAKPTKAAANKPTNAAKQAAVAVPAAVPADAPADKLAASIGKHLASLPMQYPANKQTAVIDEYLALLGAIVAVTGRDTVTSLDLATVALKCGAYRGAAGGYANSADGSGSIRFPTLSGFIKNGIADGGTIARLAGFGYITADKSDGKIRSITITDAAKKHRYFAAGLRTKNALTAQRELAASKPDAAKQAANAA